MITEVEKQPITAASYPFASVGERAKFEAYGYVEEEYFFKGTANVYEETGRHQATVIHPDNPYTNRMLVRRPENMEAFDGDVVIEILNATAGFDLDRMWILGAEELMRRNVIYIGVTSRPEMLDALRIFDEDRYRILDWTIHFERKPTQQKANLELAPKYPDRETGLIWDMLTDLADYVREEDNILIHSPKKRHVYLAGWSQSANYLVTYVRYFIKQGQRNTAFDGYLAAGNIHHFVTALNQERYGRISDTSLTMVDYMPVPYIAVQTESENGHFGGYECRQNDSDEENLKYRLYEIAGSTHDTKHSLLDYYMGDEKAKERERVLCPEYGGIDVLPTDYPYEFLMHAIYGHLFRWVREGILPPHAEPIRTNENRDNCVDQYGNAVGGLRTPFLDVPVCRYCPCSPVLLPDGTVGENPLFGYTEPFSAEKLKEMYGTLRHYEMLVSEETDRDIARGYLVPEDREACIHAAVKKASEYGLQ